MWQTHITVAAVIEKDQKFLLVTDQTAHGLKLNQPAGHTEPNEDLISAVIREVNEETSLEFIPEKVIGIYMYHPNSEHTYLRVCFKGKVTDDNIIPRPKEGDDGVVEANWYSIEEIRSKAKKWRSPLVMKCIEDYLSGTEFSLAVLAK